MAHYLCNILCFDMQIVSSNIAETFRHLYDNIFLQLTMLVVGFCSMDGHHLRLGHCSAEMDRKIGNLAGTMAALISFKSFPVFRTLTAARKLSGMGFIHYRETCKQDATGDCLRLAGVGVKGHEDQH